MATTGPPLSPQNALPIADARYLWSEVERLKTQVHNLKHAERHAQDEQQRLKEYVGSFVTKAQLDAALCTKISQSSVVSAVERLRSELLDQLEKKADMDVLQALQTKKLDISVYESSTWDLKKFRTTLEQNVHDLFAQFAHQIETQVSGKLSIDDFDRIFNPEANGQKAAIETAAARIARMNEQLESLQEYVHADRQRQHKLADLNVGLLDLTRKHNASRNSIAQLFSSFENVKDRTHAAEEDNTRVRRGFEELVARVGDFHATIQNAAATQQQSVDAMRGDVDALTRTSQQTVQTLVQIQQFTQNTLLKGVDARLSQMNEAMLDALGDARDQQLKLKAQTAQQLSKLTDRVTQTMEQQAVLESRLRRVETTTASVRDDVAAVKGPLLTVARNLREENVAILEEIRRSQDESRDILIDYKGVLEKDALVYGHPAAAGNGALPPTASRPSSSAAAASRKHRQQQIHALATRIGDVARPQTSNARLGGGGSSPASSRLRSRTASVAAPPPSPPPRSPGLPHRADECNNQPPSAALPQRPRSEAGPRPKKSLLYTIGAMGGSSVVPSLNASAELFTFPPNAEAHESDGAERPEDTTAAR